MGEDGWIDVVATAVPSALHSSNNPQIHRSLSLTLRVGAASFLALDAGFDHRSGRQLVRESRRSSRCAIPGTATGSGGGVVLRRHQPSGPAVLRRLAAPPVSHPPPRRRHGYAQEPGVLPAGSGDVVRGESRVERRASRAGQGRPCFWLSTPDSLAGRSAAKTARPSASFLPSMGKPAARRETAACGHGQRSVGDADRIDGMDRL